MNRAGENKIPSIAKSWEELKAAYVEREVPPELIQYLETAYFAGAWAASSTLAFHFDATAEIHSYIKMHQAMLEEIGKKKREFQERAEAPRRRIIRPNEH